MSTGRRRATGVDDGGAVASPPAGQAFAHRIPALDGLRAVAVIVVFLFHSGVSWLPGGFLGLDLFFVLSGYLITTLLLREQQASGRIDLLRFWTRRVQRLLPALLVMVAAVSAVLVLRPEGAPPAFRGDALSTLGYVANWRFAFGDRDYFADFADPSTLQHTWSLAVEEQFYLLWPLVLIGVFTWWRSGRDVERARRVLIGGSAALVLISAGWMAALVRDPDLINRAYNGTDTRLQSILIGALLALVTLHVARAGTPSRGVRAGLAAAATAGVAVTVWLWANADGATSSVYRGGFLLASVAVAAVIAAVALDPRGGFARVLGVWPLRALGRVSYAFYLWHWPVQLALTGAVTGLTGNALFALRFAVTLALATASWFLVERPVLRLRPRPTRLVPVVGTAAAVLAGAVFVAAAPSVLAAAGEEQEVRLPAAALEDPGPTAAPLKLAPRTAVLLGDSLADSFARGLAPVDDRYGWTVRNGGIVGCGISTTELYRLAGETAALADECAQWRRTWTAALRSTRASTAVIVIGRHETWDVEFGGRWTHIGDPAYDDYLRSVLDDAIEVAGSTGARVVVTTSPYFERPERPDGRPWPENEPQRIDRWNALVRSVVAAHPDVRLIDLGVRVSPGGRYAATVDGVRLRSDGVHFTPAGSAALAPWFLPLLTP